METISEKPKKGRKFKYDNQGRAERKRRCNNNEAFIDTKGNVRLPKEFKEVQECCNKNCHQIVGREDQLEIFNQFHHLGSYPSRATFIAANIHMKKSKFPSKKFDQKSHSDVRVYYVRDKPVCASFFSSLLSIDVSRVYLALKKFKEYNLEDRRGKYPHKSMSNYKKQFAKDFILSIPRYVSHYCRESTSASYLGCEWDKSKLHQLYKALWENKHPDGGNAMSRSCFCKVFDGFNLKFKGRVKDACKTCDLLNIRKKSGDDIEELQKLHHENAALMRGLMKDDLARAKSEESLEVITFDFQKVLQFPKLETSVIYYLRQMNLLNFGIHSGKGDQGFFLNWIETEGGRGADEVGSCLFQFIFSLPSTVTTLRGYCDNCGGQNKNLKLILMLMKILQMHPTLSSITLRFLVSGHSYLPNDAEFGHLETLIRKQQSIEIPSQYRQLMESCHVNAKKIRVIEMNKEDFLSSEPLLKGITRRGDSMTKEKINFRKVQQISIRKDQPSKIFFKYHVNTEQQLIMDIRKRLKGPEVNWSLLEFGSKEPRPLSREKMEDLKKIIPLVSTASQAYLSTFLDGPSANFIDDVDGFDEMEDDS